MTGLELRADNGTSWRCAHARRTHLSLVTFAGLTEMVTDGALSTDGAVAELADRRLDDPRAAPDVVLGLACGVRCMPDSWSRRETCHLHTIENLRAENACLKAQLDRARIYLIKSRDAADLAIGETALKVEGVEAGGD